MEPLINENQIKIGVLALQGGFREHVNMIKSIKHCFSECENKFKYSIIVEEVKSVSDIKKLNPHGMILPGGESTSMAIIASGNDDENIFTFLKDYLKQGHFIWGTCAGSIMLSNKVDGQKIGGQSLIGGLDVLISRNYFGRQIDSFETKINLNLKYGKNNNNNNNNININSVLSLENFEAIFIRAPAILDILDKENVEIIGDFIVTKKDGTKEKVITAVKQNNIIASVFHPELTNDNRFHKYFVQLVLNNHLTKINI
ncbi:hypothetical protein RB653_008483 [Dictyostelium firmibasis]|uniref:Glutaminase n=1 Tax=Dictyostelium firmibasis TaxID=79012 RepID=A0AAN7YZT1_9MYCE